VVAKGDELEGLKELKILLLLDAEFLKSDLCIS
jgi:hypothetical protein